jgi:hypothetical protein
VAAHLLFSKKVSHHFPCILLRRWTGVQICQGLSLTFTGDISESSRMVFVLL